MIERTRQILLAAQGYCELGMFDDALLELNGLPRSEQERSPAIDMRLAVLMQAKRWKAALPVSRELCRLHPQKNSGYIHAAFCLHEIGNTTEARDILLNGPSSLHVEPTFHYNLACYECTLGNLEVARVHLQKCFELDKKFRDFAKTDPDLAPLHLRLDRQ